MTSKLVWETIEQQHAGQLARSRTPGGWLVCYTDEVMTPTPHNNGMVGGYEWRSSIAFVPDPDGSWLKEEAIIDTEIAHPDDQHFVTVPEILLPDGRLVPAFKYAKYPAAKGADGLLLSVTAKPWVNVSYFEAVAACLAAGYQLARETQELAVRQNVAQQAINWSGGQVGQGKLYQGLHKGTVRGAQAAGYVSDDADERSWHELSNGERVYGLAGNVFTWVFDDVQGDSRGVIATPFEAGGVSIATAPYPSMTHGMGFVPKSGADWSGFALVRGGCWDVGDYAGVFLLGVGSPDCRRDRVGFRCTK